MRGKNKKIVFSLAGTLMIVVAVIIFVVVILNSNKETRISADDTSTALDVLVCKASDAKGPFFNRDEPSKTLHELKIIFKNDKAEKINYTYTGSYTSEEMATKAKDWLHADYNIHMVSTGIHQEALLPTFSVIESDVIINFTIEQNNFTSGTAKLVFLDGNNFLPMNRYTVNDLKNKLKDRGFACQYN